MTTVTKLRSTIWTVFDKIDRQQGRCKLCRKTYKTSGNTTNMKEHLRRKHTRHFMEIFPNDKGGARVKPEKVMKFQKTPSRKELTFDTRFLESIVSNAEPSSFSFSESDYEYAKSPYAQDKDEENDCNGYKLNYKIDAPDSNELRRALNYFIVHDCLPFDTVDGEGFKYFASVWQPHFKPPSRRTFLRNIESLAQNLSDLISEELSAVEHVSLTADIWTETVPVNRPVKNFVGLTAHYLHDYKRVSRMIGVKEMSLGYTKESFESVLDEVLGRWGLHKSKVIAFMTENDEVLVEAVRSYFGSHAHLYSFLHLLNVTVMKSFGESPQFSEIVKQIKEIVTFCRENSEIMERLATEQMKNGCSSSEIVTLIQDTSTQWTSTILMLERFSSLYKHIACLAVDVEGFPLVINNRELESLKECLMLLQPLEEVMKEISAENQMPISKTIPLVRCLENALLSNHLSTDVAEDLRTKLVEQLKKQFGDIELSRIHACATVLDPRFKTLHLTSATDVAQALLVIIDEFSRVEEVDNKMDAASDEILPDQKQMCLWDHHESLTSKTTAPISICVQGGEQPNVPISFQQFLNSGVIHREEDPLVFWQRYSFVYPEFTSLALKYFSILGALAPSDRFSVYMSKLVTKSKNRLHPKQLENMLMLNSLSLVEWEKIHTLE